jgi:uncharacterized membrane protein
MPIRALLFRREESMPSCCFIGHKHWICLGLILTFAVAIRLHGLNRNSLWADEFLSLECSSGWARTDQQFAGQTLKAPDLISLQHAKSWTAIWSSISTDENHPPLYFILLRAWRSVFGDGEIALRAMSVTASMLCLVLLFLIAASMGSPTAGLWACLLMALSGPQIEQAQDARSYAPMLLAVLAGALALVRIDRFGPNRRRCIALGSFALIAPLIHYMALATIGAMLVYAIVGMTGKSRTAALRSLLIAIAAYLVLWGPAIVAQHYRMNDDTRWLVDDHPAQHACNLIVDLLTLPARMFLNYDFDQDKLPALCLGGSALLLPVLLYRRHRSALLWGIWFIVPLAVVAMIDLFTLRRSMGMSKYTIAIAPTIFLMMGLLATELRRVGWMAPVLVAGSCAASLPAFFQAPQFPDWREVADYVDHHAKPGDPVLFVDARPDNYSAASLLSAEYYLPGASHPLYVVDRQPTGALLKSLMKANRVCIIAADQKSLRMPSIPGLELQHGELLPGMAVAGTIAPPKPTQTVARGIQ